MPDLVWRKSSYSGSDGGQDCVETATDEAGRIHLRESDAPAKVIAAVPGAFVALLQAVKAGGLDGPV